VFERDLAREKAQGYRGPFTRLAGPISDANEARLVIREMSFGLVLLAALQVAHGYAKHPFAAIFIASVITLPAALLLFTLSRVAAVAVALVGALLFANDLLVSIEAGAAPIPPVILFHAIYLFLAVRAVLAAFRRKRFLHSAPSVVAPPVGT
jgi:hypothetical protein